MQPRKSTFNGWSTPEEAAVADKLRAISMQHEVWVPAGLANAIIKAWARDMLSRDTEPSS